MNRRAVVTGGAGFLGSHLSEALADRGWEVVALDDFSTGRPSNLAKGLAKGVRAVEVDITAPGLDEVMAEASAQVVFHLAAVSSVTLCEKDPDRCREVNVDGAVAVLESAARRGVERLVNVSSLAVHGARPGGTGVDYGSGKRTAEQRLAERAPAGLDWVTLRPANVYGPRQLGDGESAVIATWLDAMASRRSLFVDGDGLQTRDFLYVTDAVEAMIAAADRAEGTVIELGGGVETSLLDLLETMKRVTGWDGTPLGRPARTGDIRRSVVDPRPAASELGWKARTDLENGLRQTWEWMTAS